MSSPAAIKAVSHFTANGNSKKVSLISELAIGLTLGLGAGLWWKTYHWAEKHKIETYYYDLQKLNKTAGLSPPEPEVEP